MLYAIGIGFVLITAAVALLVGAFPKSVHRGH
jgi:hypothetical protein